MSALQLITQAATVLPMAGDDLIGFTNEKVNAVGALFRTSSIVIGVGFVLFQAIVTRGALARIVISAISAAVFIWVVFNVTSLRDRVDNEMNTDPLSSAPASTHQPSEPQPE